MIDDMNLEYDELPQLEVESYESSGDETVSERNRNNKNNNNNIISSSPEPRGRFGNRLEGILYCIGFAVGIGHVWRFPFLVYQNGGGAFLFAYVVLMLTIGVPLYSMELIMGQFSGRGSLEIWKCLPLAKGIGYAMVTISLPVAIYYNVILAYTLYYLAQSFRSVLPWSDCYDWWVANREICFVRQKDVTLCRSTPYRLYARYGRGRNVSDENVSLFYEGIQGYFNAPLADFNALMANCSNSSTSAAEMFWERYVLDISPSIAEVGGLKWDLVLCLFISWLIVYLCLVRGVSSSGKVVYLTATFPYIVLSILLIKVVALEGAMLGIKYFLVPDFSKLTSIAIWRKAAEQLFYSLGIGWGGLIINGSYNNFRANVTIDTTIVIIAGLLTSFLGGIVIFSVLGYMSVTYGLPVEEVVKAGQGLAFVVYPEALTHFSFPQFWSVIFFVMLYLLGIDSEFLLVQTCLSVLSDAFPTLRGSRVITALVTCVACFTIGLTCVTRGGQYVLNLLDTYCAGILLLIIAALEIVAIMWIYGIRNFSSDVKFMLGEKPNILFRLSWTIISPLVLIALINHYFYEWTPILYNNTESYPAWADYLGFAFAAFSVIQVLIVAVVVIFKKKGLTDALKPEEEWGPGERQLLKEYKQYRKSSKEFELRQRF